MAKYKATMTIELDIEAENETEAEIEAFNSFRIATHFGVVSAGYDFEIGVTEVENEQRV